MKKYVVLKDGSQYFFGFEDRTSIAPNGQRCRAAMFSSDFTEAKVYSINDPALERIISMIRRQDRYVKVYVVAVVGRLTLNV